MSNINRLVDDCLMTILALLSLQELLQVTPVCRRWKALCDRVAAQRKYLYLCSSSLCFNMFYDGGQIGRKSPNRHKPLIVNNLTSQRQYTLKLIVYKFPNITSLEIRQRLACDTVRNVTYLLGQWPNLVSLKLFIGGLFLNSRITTNDWNSLLKQAGTLKSLKHLTVCENNDHMPSRVELPQSLSRLHEFYFGLMFAHSARAMNQIGQWRELNKFGMLIDTAPSNDVPLIRDQYKNALATKHTSTITELMIDMRFEWFKTDFLYKSFYPNYSSLTHLYLRIHSPLPWMMLNSGLHHLHNLSYLRINNFFLPPGAYRENQAWSKIANEPKYPEYPSLHTLHLLYVPRFKFDWAPNVLTNCSVMCIDYRQMNNSRSEGKLVLKSMKLLRNLRKVILADQVYIVQPGHVENIFL